MKKIFKKTLFIILCLTICLMLTSCKALDEAKATHMIYGETYDEVYFRGETYKRLSGGNDLVLKKAKTAYITQEDVPVLLRDMFGNTVRYSEDLSLVEVEDNKYCKQEFYDHYTELIKNHTLDHYCVYIGYYSDDEYVNDYVLLNDELTNIINYTLESAIPITDNSLEYYHQMSIHYCDKDAIFTKYGISLVRCDIDGSSRFVLIVEEKFSEAYYPVSAEHNTVILEFLDYVENHQMNMMTAE